MLAIIPARGGSKGLPGKNIRPLAGVPLICHTIKAALEAKSVTRVVVSTDDEKIAKVSKEYGAEVPYLRPLELAGDTCMVMDAYLHMVDTLMKESGEPIESFVALLPTVPLRLADDIDKAVNIFTTNKADSVISITEPDKPIQWYRKITDEGILANYLPDFSAIQNRQEQEKTYVPNGAIYIFRTEKLRSTREYYTEKTYPYLMPRERSSDIDTLHDFEWLEFLYNKKNV